MSQHLLLLYNSYPFVAMQFMRRNLRCPITGFASDFRYGGSFGIKITNYPQMSFVPSRSKKAGGRPVKWIETRSEHNISSAHGTERTFRDTRVTLDKDGVITAIDSRHIV